MLLTAALLLGACEKDGAAGHRAKVLLNVRSAGENPEQFIATQAVLIKGQSVLEAAAEGLGLAERWGVTDAAAAAARLAPSVSAAPIERTSLIELAVRLPDAAEAAEIANAIAETFVTRVTESEALRANEQLEKLGKQIEEQQTAVDKKREAMLKLMEEHKIIDLSLNNPPWGPGQQQGGLAPGLPKAEIEAAVANLQTTIDALESLSGEQLIKAAMDLQLTQPELAVGYPEYQKLLVSKQTLLQSGLGSKHPRLVALEQQISSLRQMLLKAGESARDALRSQLELTEKRLAEKEKAED